MSVVVSNSNSMVLRKLLVMLQVQLQTVYSHHALEFYCFDTGSGRYISYVDWAGVAVPRVASYTAVVAALCEGIYRSIREAHKSCLHS